MYKRKPRILFVDVADSPLLASAGWIARELGSEWFDADTASVGQSEDAISQLWPDLLVYLTVSAKNASEANESAVTKKCYYLDDMPLHEASEAIRERIAGMIGGIRLLARSD